MSSRCANCPITDCDQDRNVYECIDALQEYADRPQGEWIDAKNAGWKCTVCGKWSNGQYDYCPNCGAEVEA